MNEITTLVSSVGFPIVACIYMATTMQKCIDKNTETLEKNTDILDKILSMLNLQEREEKKND